MKTAEDAAIDRAVGLFLLVALLVLAVIIGAMGLAAGLGG